MADSNPQIFGKIVAGVCMNWLRWYTGSATDSKFAVVARRSGQNVAAVLGVWCMLLERASDADERGSIDGFDCEGADVILGLEDGAACSIVEAMKNKGLVSNGRITNWEKRQPKREDTGSTNRVREYRARQKSAHDETPCNDVKHDETKCNATKREETLDKSRVEEKRIEEKYKNAEECSEPSLASEPAPAVLEAAISLPLNTGDEHPVTFGEIEQWQDLYPAVDVMQALRNMRGWLLANKAKRKTKTGIGRFIQAWLAREQNTGGTPRASPVKAQPSHRPSPPEESQADRAARLTWEAGQRILERERARETQLEASQ